MPLAKGRNFGRDRWRELRNSESATIACCSLLLLSLEVVVEVVAPLVLVVVSGHCINLDTLMGDLRLGGCGVEWVSESVVRGRERENVLFCLYTCTVRLYIIIWG